MNYNNLPAIMKSRQIKYSEVKEKTLKQIWINYRVYPPYIYYETPEKELVDKIKKYVLKYWYVYTWYNYKEVIIMLNMVDNIEDFYTYWLDIDRLYIENKKIYNPFYKKELKEKIWKKNLKSIDIEDIDRLNIVDILNKLWVEFKEKWDSIILYEDWHWTDWWRWSIKDNFIKDFSWNWRPHWWPFNFLKEYLNLSNAETFNYFKDLLWI